MQFIKRLETQLRFVVLMGASIIFSASSASATIKTILVDIDVDIDPALIKAQFPTLVNQVDVVQIGGIVDTQIPGFTFSGLSARVTEDPFATDYYNNRNVGGSTFSIFLAISQLQGIFSAIPGNTLRISLDSGANLPALPFNGTTCKVTRCVRLHYGYAEEINTTNPALNPNFIRSFVTFRDVLNPNLNSTLQLSVLSPCIFIGGPNNVFKCTNSFNSLTGAGSSSITTLADVVSGDPRFAGSRYIVTGDGAGRTALINGLAPDGTPVNYAATDGLSNLVGPGSKNIFAADGTKIGTTPASTDLVAFQEATLNIAFPYNVVDPLSGQPFDVTIDEATACSIIIGTDLDGNTIDNWSQIINANGDNGPDLPIIRVVHGDNSGMTATLQNGFVGPVCADFFGFTDENGNPVNITTSGGAFIPNQRPTDISVPSQDIINNVLANSGAFGYTETTLAVANGFDTEGVTLVGDADNGNTTTFAIGPTFLVFRLIDLLVNPDVQNACSALTDTNNILAAGFSGDELGPDAVEGGNPACLEF